MSSFSRMSIFDLDHTLLRGNSSFHFGMYLFRQHALSYLRVPYVLCCYGLHKGNFLALSSLHNAVFKTLFQGRSLASYSKYVAAFLQQELDKLLYLPAIKQLQHAQKRGDFVAILSSSPEFLVTAIAEKLAVTCARGSIYALDHRDCFSHISFLMEGREKAVWVDEKSKHLQIARINVTAYTDSILDLPLLLSAGRPIAANPDKELRALAKCNAWEII